jgi:hypothetical protein
VVGLEQEDRGRGRGKQCLSIHGGEGWEQPVIGGRVDGRPA